MGTQAGTQNYSVGSLGSAVRACNYAYISGRVRWYWHTLGDMISI